MQPLGGFAQFEEGLYSCTVAQLTIHLPVYDNQTEFNLQRWEEICADPTLASLEQKIETDRHGTITMGGESRAGR